MKAIQLALAALDAAKNGINWWHDAAPGLASPADGEMIEQIDTAVLALGEIALSSGIVAEWQARVGEAGRWTRIDPPRGTSMAKRIAELRAYKTAAGQPAYQIRALFAAEADDPS